MKDVAGNGKGVAMVCYWGVAFGVLLTAFDYGLWNLLSVFEHNLVQPAWTIEKFEELSSILILPFIVVSVLRFLLFGSRLERLRFLAGIIVVLIVDLIVGYLMLVILIQSVAS